MTIIALPAFTDNYIWIIVNEAEHTFVCVDPGDATPVLAYAKDNGLVLTDVLVTHHHHDHAGGLADLLQAFPNVTIYGPIDSRIPLVNCPVHDEDIVQIANLNFRVLSTPGHTSSHVCYQEPTQGWLFCGDTLFSAGCGRVFDGTMEQLYQSLMLLKDLPADTKVYCGHEYTRHNLRFAAMVEPENATIKSYSGRLELEKNGCSLPSTIALEREINPFMRVSVASIGQFAQDHGVNLIDPLNVFRLLRGKKDSFQ